MRRLVPALVLSALLVATGARPAAAQLAGSFDVGDGPAWETNPPPYSCLEACVQVFGGTPASYSCSTSDQLVDHRAWLDGWGDVNTYCGTTPGSESFSLGGNYDCGSEGCSYSAYVEDHTDECIKTNYCWAAVTCGNGVQETGEVCDDGNTLDGDCCNATCTGGAPDGASCSDGNACNGEETCQAAACQAGAPPDCADADPCTHESCDPNVGCVAGDEPLAMCNETATAATLAIDASKRKLSYSWSKGTVPLAALGDPIGSHPYTVCVYDAEGVVQSLYLDNGGNCGNKPCWKATGSTGFAYKDKAGVQSGVRSMKLKASESGKAKMSVAASGDDLGAIDLGPSGLAAPITVQIVSFQNECFGASFETGEIKTNDGAKVKAKHAGAAPN